MHFLPFWLATLLQDEKLVKNVFGNSIIYNWQMAHFLKFILKIIILCIILDNLYENHQSTLSAKKNCSPLFQLAHIALNMQMYDNKLFMIKRSRIIHPKIKPFSDSSSRDSPCPRIFSFRASSLSLWPRAQFFWPWIWQVDYSFQSKTSITQFENKSSWIFMSN